MLAALRTAIVGLGLALLAGPSVWAEDVDRQSVTIGYQLVYNPWKVAISTGAFEAATGFDIKWRQFDSGAKVITALAAGDVQMAMAGSSPIAAGVSRELDIELVWVLEDIASAEALVVRDGAGITAPQDLVGKRLAAPFASTTHFHSLFALEQFGIDPSQVTIVNKQPPEIVESWQRGEIDAAFVWEPALGEIKKTGKVLITSGLLSSWGKATFDGIVASREFTKQNPDFMCRFIKTIAEADDAYRRDPSAWTPSSPAVQAIVELVGGDAKGVPDVLALYSFPTLEEQASARWLGGGAARALRFTSEFLLAERKIPFVLDDYQSAVNPLWTNLVLDGAC